MKKLLLICLIVLAMVFVACETKVSAFTLIDTEASWKVHFTTPNELGVTGFWFPKGGGGFGSNYTWGRLSCEKIPHLMLDGDLLIAKKFATDPNPQYGPGIKLATDAFKIDISENTSLFASIGFGWVNDFQDFESFNDLIDKFEKTFYGTFFMYKF